MSSVEEPADERDHLVDVLGGMRALVRPQDAETVHGVEPDRSHFSVISSHGRSSRRARSMILSSMSVTLETNVTSLPVQAR